MRKNAFSIVLATAVLGLFVSVSSAHHIAGHDQNPNPPAVSAANSILHFASGSLIIPMDVCYARTSFAANAEVDSVVSPSTSTTAKCNSAAEKDDGLIPAYSLMFRLVEAGIPVNWAIGNSKAGWNSVDFSVVKASKSPVLWWAPTQAATSAKYSTITTVSYRGAPFVIDASYAAAAIAKMNTLATTYTAYKQVDVHIAQTSFDAPIYKQLTDLPKLAVIDISDAATNLHNQKTIYAQDLISDAVMDDMVGDLWDWVTIPQVNAGALSSYDLAWVPSFDVDQPGMPTAAQTDFFAKLAAFADGGGSILFQDGAIGAMEGYGTMAGMTYTASKPSTQNFMTSGGGIVPDGVSSTWDNGSAFETTLSSDYSDPASQFGGDIWTGIGGSKYNWKPRYDKAYKNGVRRMVYSKSTTGDDSKNRWDFAAWRHYNNDSSKGTIYYLGGEHWRRTTAAGFRIVMNTILTTNIGQHTTSIEVARGSPTLATVDDVETEYGGTFDEVIPPQTAPTFTAAGDATNFVFPFVTGHLRAVDISKLDTGETSTTTAAASGAILWDANTLLPAVNYTTGCGDFPINDHAACRRIWTDTGSDYKTRTLVITANHTTLQPLLGVSTTGLADTLISRIHAGTKSGASYVASLGGIDRSTPAVIEASNKVSGGATRPTMVYVGGRDGMMHAICATVAGQCATKGKELWAFLPDSEIGHVRLNSTRIDGSPKVADVYGVFGTSTTIAAKTVLVFQTGNQSASATYALDISDPANPSLLWRLSTPGPGVNTAIGWVRDLATVKAFAFVQSAFDPTGVTPGFELRAVEIATGDVRWTWSFPYNAARDPANPNVPITAVPGGVTIVPGDGSVTDSLLVPTLYGRVFRIDPLTGENLLGSDALFDMGEDFHPIGTGVTLYRDAGGVLHGLVVTGGFVDPFSPSGTSWAPDDVHQYAVGFPVLSDTTVTRAQVQADDSLGIHIDFGAGQRAFSPAVIAGSEIFVTTDTTNVNAADYEATTSNTGTLWRYSMGTGSTTTTVVRSGAASPEISLTTGSVLTGGRSSYVKTQPANFAATGSSTEMSPTESHGRQLWLRIR